VIDGGIRIVVLASGQRCVRLGIEAPAQVGIVREEIISRNENAAGNRGNGHSAGQEEEEEEKEKEKDNPGR
jgi:sRNA-binding carbon storage regulator CsrA